jgi:AcrR family transcriptional regulator
MAPAQVALAPTNPMTIGLRERKKVRTRVAIEDAALELFEDQGYEATTVDEIAARADVSTTTFFRYFPSKGEVLLSDHGQELPALRQAIVGRPTGDSDLIAVWRAIQDTWVGAVDPARTARKAKIIATSASLSGVSFLRGHQWLAVIADALAERNGLPADAQRAELAARVALEAMGTGVDRWMAGGCRGEISEAIDLSFRLMMDVCADLARATRRRPAP